MLIRIVDLVSLCALFGGGLLPAAASHSPRAQEGAAPSARAEGEAATPSGHETLTIQGWQVHLSRRLKAELPEETKQMLPLLDRQLKRVVDAVPSKALAELQKVPIWINPAYPGKRPGAEYHPGARWLRDNGRDPVMAKAVEITNVSNFAFENRRMPDMMLHELAHAYHDRVLGFGHPAVVAAFDRAEASGDYEAVRRFTGRKFITDKAYALSNAREYFAETTEAFFGRNDFFPFSRRELREFDPRMHDVLASVWGTPETLRILCYNIHYGQGNDGKYDLERLSQVIQDVNPDLVALQEVDAVVRRSGQVHQPRRLAELTGMAVRYGPTQHFQGGLYGNAVLTRLPITDVEIVPLPYTETHPKLTTYPRGAIAVTVKMPNGAPLRFISTHFQHNLEPDRVQEAEAVNRWFGERAGASILAGDFNAEPGSEAIRILHSCWQDTTPESPAATAPSDHPRARIDYIMYRGPGLNVKSSRVIPESIASDHRPVLAVFDLTKAAEPSKSPGDATAESQPAPGGKR